MDLNHRLGHAWITSSAQRRGGWGRNQRLTWLEKLRRQSMNRCDRLAVSVAWNKMSRSQLLFSLQWIGLSFLLTSVPWFGPRNRRWSHFGATQNGPKPENQKVRSGQSLAWPGYHFRLFPCVPFLCRFGTSSTPQGQVSPWLIFQPSKVPFHIF